MRTPVAAASLGQVHRARVDGREVVVKVLRPEVEQLVALDLDISFRILFWLNVLFPNHHVRALTGVVREFSHKVRQEMDFRMESEHMARFRETFRTDRRVRVPQVIDRFTRRAIPLAEIVVGDAVVATPEFASPARAHVPAWRNTDDLAPRSEYRLDARAGGPYGIEWTINGEAYGHAEHGTPPRNVQALPYGEWSKLRFLNDSFRLHPMRMRSVRLTGSFMSMSRSRPRHDPARLHHRVAGACAVGSGLPGRAGPHHQPRTGRDILARRPCQRACLPRRHSALQAARQARRALNHATRFSSEAFQKQNKKTSHESNC